MTPRPINSDVRRVILRFMFRLLASVAVTLALASGESADCHAQVSTVPSDWQKVSACQIRFLVPKDLKNQHVRGIDTCFFEMRNGRMKLAIDAGGFAGGGDFVRTATMLDFNEENVVIDGKKVQIVSIKMRQANPSASFSRDCLQSCTKRNLKRRKRAHTCL